MSASYRTDPCWIAAQEAYADPAWDDDPDAVYVRRIVAACELYAIERQYAAPHLAGHSAGSKGLPMLDDIARVTNYFQQTGRATLTARQQRRVNKKRRHQEAQGLRASAVGGRRAVLAGGALHTSVPDGAAPGRVTGPNHKRKNLMKRLILTFAGVLALMFGGLSLPAASAAAGVEGLAIVNLGYNARGADTVWNRNKEYVDIKAFANVDVKGLKLYDAWGKANQDDERGCNRFEVTSLPGITEVDGKVTLPAGHTIRIHSGWGNPSVTGTRHNVYMNSGAGSKLGCGYHGHIWNNLVDTAHIELNGNEESETYDFEAGYTVRP